MLKNDGGAVGSRVRGERFAGCHIGPIDDWLTLVRRTSDNV